MSNTIHLIGSAHLDPVWLWRYEEGLAEIKATFQSALDRLDEFDDFVFTCSSASYYKWVEKNAPEMFEKIFTGRENEFDFSKMGEPAVENTSIADYVWLPLRFTEPDEEHPDGMVYIDWLDSWKIEDYE